MGEGKLVNEEIKSEKDFKIFETLDGQKYYFNKRLFFFGSLILLLIVLGILFKYDSLETQYYIECNHEQCFNEFYQSPSCGKTLPADKPICTKQFFLMGESYGTKQPIYVTYSYEGAFLFILVLYLFNDLFYNKRFNYKKFFGGILK